MIKGRQLIFSGVPSRAVFEMIDLLRSYGTDISAMLDLAHHGTAEHPMGAVSFHHDLDLKRLTITIERSSFPGTMLLGGIRQHVEEILEKYRDGSEFREERPQSADAEPAGRVANL